MPNNFAVAVGVENAVEWANTDGGSSIYGVATKVFPLRKDPAAPLSRFTVSVGLGSDCFLSEEDREDGVEGVNVFDSAALQVIEPVSLITEWTGQDLFLGASIVPFRGLPLVITPGIADVTGNAGDGARFIFGVGYGYSS